MTPAGDERRIKMPIKLKDTDYRTRLEYSDSDANGTDLIGRTRKANRKKSISDCSQLVGPNSDG